MRRLLSVEQRDLARVSKPVLDSGHRADDVRLLRKQRRLNLGLRHAAIDSPRPPLGVVEHEVGAVLNGGDVGAQDKAVRADLAERPDGEEQAEGETDLLGRPIRQAPPTRSDRSSKNNGVNWSVSSVNTAAEPPSLRIPRHQPSAHRSAIPGARPPSRSTFFGTGFCRTAQRAACTLMGTSALIACQHLV